MSSSRDLQFDGLKFLLIFLVVLGHLTFKDYGIGVKRMIFSFHMPVFLFLSGYFTSLSSSIEKQNKWLKKTLFLFIIAHLAQLLLRILLAYVFCRSNGSAFNLSSLLKWDAFICPGYALWYLVCLMYWRVFIWKIGNCLNDILLFIFSCVAAFLVGFIPLDTEFSFQRTFAFFPFFLLGIVVKKRHLIQKIEQIPIWVAIIGIVIGLLVARKLPTYLPAYHYVSVKHLLLRIIQTTLGLYLSILVIRVSRCRFTEFFAKFGSKTLWIYIGHTYLIILGRYIYPLLGISFNFFTAVLVAILYCAFIFLIANAYERVREKRLIVVSQQNTEL